VTTRESLEALKDIAEHFELDEAARIAKEALETLKTVLALNNVNGVELRRTMPITKFDIGTIATMRYTTVNIPSYHLVIEAKMCIGRQARAYTTGLYLVDYKIVNYDYLRTLDDFHGSGSYESVVIVEVYEDRGDDGNIAYKLFGHRAVTTTVFKAECHDAIKNERMPDCMCLSSKYADW